MARKLGRKTVACSLFISECYRIGKQVLDVLHGSDPVFYAKQLHALVFNEKKANSTYFA
jgi:hypothetical protein